jgi:hypothetical protein
MGPPDLSHLQSHSLCLSISLSVWCLSGVREMKNREEERRKKEKRKRKSGALGGEKRKKKKRRERSWSKREKREKVIR